MKITPKALIDKRIFYPVDFFLNFSVSIPLKFSILRYDKKYFKKLQGVTKHRISQFPAHIPSRHVHIL